MKNIVIISQDKKIAINYNNIFALGIEKRYYEGKLKDWRIAAKNVGTGHLTTLGFYASEDRCVEVFNAITDKIVRDAGRIEMPER
jgi:hypothetical protein